MTDRIENALELMANRGDSLRTEWSFDWPASSQQAVCRLRLGLNTHPLPVMVAMVGGASSGKSTVFNNLLGGHLASRIAAQGHTTLGPILAAHETHRQLLERLFDRHELLPGYHHVLVGLDSNATGEIGTVVTLFHTMDAFRDVLLFDLPDFTSEDARRDGDITLSLLPWFDRVIVVVDHERWFDRQSVSQLHAESARYGQQRWVVFNRAHSGLPEGEVLASLDRQADRLGANGMNVLESRLGRGFCSLPPGTLEAVTRFVQDPAPDRTRILRGQVAEAANRVLNQNEERTARLEDLKRSLAGVVERTMPSVHECTNALMTARERRQIEFASRVLRIEERKRWLVKQTRRFQHALTQVPLVGAMVGPVRGPIDAGAPDTADRSTIAASYFEAVARHQVHEVQRTVRGSAFWDEIHRWTGLEPAVRDFTRHSEWRDGVERAAGQFDTALAAWLEKVERQCEGISPYLKGAVGVGGIGLAVVLIAAPGPVAALTIVSAKTAIGAALAKLLAAAGAGALAGKPLGRLTAIVEERLLGSPELDAVHAGARIFLGLLESNVRRLAEEAVAEASALVLDSADPMADALSCFRDLPEVSP